MSETHEPSARERVAELRRTLHELRGPDLPKGPAMTLFEESSPCDGYYLLAAVYLETAIAAKDDATFQLYAELADSAETLGDACVALQNTLP